MQPTVNDADLLLSFFEYQSSFRDPIFGALTSPEPIAALFRAFKEWNVSLSDVSANQAPTNAAEYQTTVELLNRRYVFSVGLGAAKLSVTNPTSGEGEQIARVINAGITAIRSTTGADIFRQTSQLSMHVKPQGGSIHKLTSRFVNPELVSVIGDKAQAFGFSVYLADSSCIVDLSALDAASLFIRLSRSYGPEVLFEEIASSLRSDQEKILEIIGVRIIEERD